MLKRGTKIGTKFTEEHRKKLSEAKRGYIPKCAGWNKGIELPKELKAKARVAMLGKHHTLESRKKISDSMKRLVKEGKHHLGDGSKTPENKRIRKSLEYKLWREAVFTRDNYTCVWCGVKGGAINADHIKPFCDYPELRFAIDNGRTLCVPCHKKTDTFLKRFKKKR